jgi:diguanylate cyclase (GGDEF)-like protein
MPSFIGKYGGDEFIIIIYPVTRGETDLLINEIRNEIDVRVKDMDYTLPISAGYDEINGKEDSFQNCIKRADSELYQDKHLRKNKLK